MALNLERQLIFYGSYHQNPVNVKIHIICVPLILISALALASNISFNAFPEYTSSNNWLPLNPGTMGSLVYAVLYVLMEPVAGGLLAPLLVAITIYSGHLIRIYGNAANYWAIGLHIFSWIAQFIGHGVFEKRAPALLDNLPQALFFAPFFVWLEVLFSCGYRPELKRRLDAAIEKEVDKFRHSQTKTSKAN